MEARPRLERVEADVMGNFKRLGVPCEPMDGRARLALLHSQMHPGNREPFRFSWKDIPQNGARHKGLYRPGQLRLPALPPVPGGPVLGRCFLLADFGVGALG